MPRYRATRRPALAFRGVHISFQYGTATVYRMPSLLSEFPIKCWLFFFASTWKDRSASGYRPWCRFRNFQFAVPFQSSNTIIGNRSFLEKKERRKIKNDEANCLLRFDRGPGCIRPSKEVISILHELAYRFGQYKVGLELVGANISLRGLIEN